MQFCISIAELTVQINSLYSHIYRICKDYIVIPNKSTNIVVRTTLEELSQDYQRTLEETGKSFSYWSHECFAVHRQIAEAIIDFDTFIMHGAVVSVNEKAYLFCAPSGIGKTTHIKLWLKNLPDAFVVNGDKPFLRITDEDVLACGSPWCGKENLGTNTMVPLKAIVFMERSDHNEIQESTFLNVFPQLLQQTYRPESAEGMGKTLQLLKKLPVRVRFYKFKFNNFEDDAFRVAYQALCADKS